MAQIQPRKRADGTTSYRVGYRHDHGDGRKLHWTPTFDTADAAVEVKDMFERLGPELALATLQTRQGRDTATGAPLLCDWFETHLEKAASWTTPGTIAGYRGDARRSWLPRLGAMPLDAITADHVSAWIAAERATETERSVKARVKAVHEGQDAPAPKMRSVKTVKNAHGLLSSVLAAAVAAGHIPTNVAYGAKLPTDEARREREKEIFTQDEWNAFIGAVQEHYRPVVHFLIGTGVRIGEASAVQVRDLDLTAVGPDGQPRPWVAIRRAWKKGARAEERYLGSPKSKRGNRTILISAALAGMIAPLLEGKTAEDLVFTSPRGLRIRSNRFNERQWNKAKRRAGITKELTPHSLRHTSASWLLMAGVSPVVVQQRLGHESLNTTSTVYSHLLMDAQVSAVDATERALGRVVAPAPLLEIEEGPDGASPS